MPRYCVPLKQTTTTTSTIEVEAENEEEAAEKAISGNTDRSKCEWEVQDTDLEIDEDGEIEEI